MIYLILFILQLGEFFIKLPDHFPNSEHTFESSSQTISDSSSTGGFWSAFLDEDEENFVGTINFDSLKLFFFRGTTTNGSLISSALSFLIWFFKLQKIAALRTWLLRGDGEVWEDLWVSGRDFLIAEVKERLGIGDCWSCPENGGLLPLRGLPKLLFLGLCFGEGSSLFQKELILKSKKSLLQYS